MPDEGLQSGQVDTPPAQAPPVASPVASDTVDPASVDVKDEATVKALLAELGRKRGEVRDLKQRAIQADQYEQWIGANQKQIEYIGQHPELLDPKPAVTTPADPAAEETARLLDLYDKSGGLDVERGKAVANLIRGEAERIAREAVAPVRETSAQERAARNYQMALQMRDASGRMVNKQHLDAVWRQVAAERGGLQTLSDPKGAAFLAAAAFGLDRMFTPAGQPAPETPPLVTEGAGGGPERSVQMSDIERKVAAARGIDDKRWQEATRRYTPGRPMQLED